MKTSQIYPGIHDDFCGGTTPTGTIIRDAQEAQVSREVGTPGATDAWTFDLLPETETCAGWDAGRIEQLYDQVTAAWVPYGHLARHLPPELRARHGRIYGEAVRRARELGWETDLSDDD